MTFGSEYVVPLVLYVMGVVRVVCVEEGLGTVCGLQFEPAKSAPHKPKTPSRRVGSLAREREAAVPQP